ncbi:hypothetical protein [Hymenobacter sp. BT559]|uniref:hypothetical protein n=1 Tax=Hymenobacter sp. BT559 TaxID=2795729 RepID=UPI0018EDB924|nr:hypothetical protein [Hymenobacter sp. BT559]MBJ6142711.1 hypothetical protein [Hymenobacter sp. BT559]
MISQQVADTIPVADVLPVLQPEFAPVAPPLSREPIKDDEFCLMCVGSLALVGVGGYLRYRRWARQRQLLAQLATHAEAEAPVYPHAKATLPTEEPLVEDTKEASRKVRRYKKSSLRIAKK